MMRQKSSDSMARDQNNSDLYYIHSSPHRRHRSGLTLDDEREKLERDLFVRLQGHKGRLLPFMGTVLKYMICGILFPAFAIGLGLKKVSDFIAAKIERILLFLTPPWLRFCGIIRRHYERIKRFILRYTERIRLVLEAMWMWLKRHFSKFFGPIIKRVSSWARVLYTWLQRQKIRLIYFAVAILKRTPLGRKLWLRYHAAITKRIANYRAYAHVVSQGKKEKVSSAQKAFRRAVRQKRLRWSAWTHVLSKYGLRVLEDWTLEVKQWFKSSPKKT